MTELTAGSWGPWLERERQPGWHSRNRRILLLVGNHILAIILLAFIVHWAGGGLLNLRLGHFVLNVGFT